MLVPWYLINSYLYYIKNQTVVSDDTYDMICRRLVTEWDQIKHPHKNVIDRMSLTAGTGYTLKESDYPSIVKGSVNQLLAGNRYG
jgi:NAD-dependent DNA ligase